ncbi:MAG TPA: hypothetical protein VH744_14510, partial [Terriglobales bacterium]
MSGIPSAGRSPAVSTHYSRVAGSLQRWNPVQNIVKEARETYDVPAIQLARRHCGSCRTARGSRLLFGLVSRAAAA